MKTRCPCCGAENSLDALIAHEEAREALWSLAQIGGPMTRGLVKYLGLFRPEKSALGGGRMATLIAELLPDIQAQQIMRDGKVYPAPVAAWAHGFATVVAARDSGSLNPPLKSHGYLYEVIARFKPAADVSSAGTELVPNGKYELSSKLRSGVAELEAWAVQTGDFICAEIAAGFARLAANHLPGRPASQDLTAVASVWADAIRKRSVHWVEADRLRFKSAFDQLVLQCTKWPAPADLLQALPPRMPTRDKELPATRADADVAQKAIEKMKNTLKGK